MAVTSSRCSSQRLHRARRPLRSGFKLVELVAVVVIVGLLLALLIPAVNSTRETPKANTCRNNMRNLALALMQYEQAHNEYPALSRVVSIAGQDVNRPLMFYLLPYIERNDLYSQYVESPTNIPAEGEEPHHLKVLVCPADFESSGAPTSYVYNCGLPNTPGANTYELTEGDTADGAGDQNARNNGVFFAHHANGANNAYYLQQHDGMATTLLVSESIEAGKWTELSEVRCGFVWHDLPNVDQVRMNARRGEARGDVAPNSDWARPSSNHYGGVNMVFADAHVTFINDTISYLTYAQLMTSCGEKAGVATPQGFTAPIYQPIHLPVNKLNEDAY